MSRGEHVEQRADLVLPIAGGQPVPLGFELRDGLARARRERWAQRREPVDGVGRERHQARAVRELDDVGARLEDLGVLVLDAL